MEQSALSKVLQVSIFLSLQHNTTLVDLNLSQTGITAMEDTTQALGEMLQMNKTLTHLDLSNNEKLADLGARCIFHYLQHNTTLADLNLSNASITTTQALGKLLRVNKTLIHLDLSKNEKLADLGARCIFHNLQHNTTLVDF